MSNVRRLNSHQHLLRPFVAERTHPLASYSQLELIPHAICRTNCLPTSRTRHGEGKSRLLLASLLLWLALGCSKTHVASRVSTPASCGCRFVVPHWSGRSQPPKWASPFGSSGNRRLCIHSRSLGQQMVVRLSGSARVHHAKRRACRRLTLPSSGRARAGRATLVLHRSLRAASPYPPLMSHVSAP